MLGDMPAYPMERSRPDLGPDAVEGFPGMTIRQRYAMAAMQGYASQGWSVPSIIAQQGFAIADAMIAFEEKEYEEKRKANEAEEKEKYERSIDEKLRNPQT